MIQNNPKLKVLLSGIGFIFILMTIAFNDLTYTFFFTPTLWTFMRTRVMIWAIDFGLILLGLFLIKKSRLKWIFDLAMGFILTIALLLGIEGLFFGLYTASSEVITIEGDFNGANHQPEPNLGYRPQPNFQMSHIRKVNGDIVYDAKYTTDAYSRRVTPPSNLDDKDQFILFFGCSFTFGIGVEDNETLPFYIAQQAPRYRVYNYGVGGYGPHQMLAHLQRDELKSEIEESSGIAVYTFIDNHINRANGMSDGLWGRSWDGPFYTLDSSGQLVRQGGFRWGRPVQSFINYTVSRSYTAKYFNLSIPRVNEAHIELTARIIEEARDAFRSKFGSEKFYVVLYPGAWEADRLIPKLEQAHIKYLDYTTLFQGHWKQFTFTGDGHPTPAGHKVIAQKLANDLGLSDQEQQKQAEDTRNWDLSGEF
jgi:hypothetical protein